MNHAVSRSGFYRAQGHRYRQSLRVRLRHMDRFRRFDEAYYHRFYESLRPAWSAPKSTRTSLRSSSALPVGNRLDLKSVLDIGAGIGLWKHWLEKHEKGVAYTGTE